MAVSFHYTISTTLNYLIHCHYIVLPMSSCMDIFESGQVESGIYTLDIGDGGSQIDVFCDMSLLGGGWTVIQRRVSNVTSFNRTWLSYKVGFGCLEGNFWMGLENIHRLLSSQNYELYIGMESPVQADPVAYARYQTFYVGSEASNYHLTVNGYDQHSTAGDSMSIHDGLQFTTLDRDNDQSPEINCAKYISSGWWFEQCFSANLNGIYYSDVTFFPDSRVPDGILYRAWQGLNTPLKTVVMAIRPHKIH